MNSPKRYLFRTRPRLHHDTERFLDRVKLSVKHSGLSKILNRTLVVAQLQIRDSGVIVNRGRELVVVDSATTVLAFRVRGKKAL